MGCAGRSRPRSGTGRARSGSPGRMRYRPRSPDRMRYRPRSPDRARYRAFGRRADRTAAASDLTLGFWVKLSTVTGFPLASISGSRQDG